MQQLSKEETEWFREELYPYEPMLRSWLCSRFPSIVDIEDCMQEAFFRTVKRNRKRRLVSPKAFLFAIARNLCIDAIRREKVIRFEPLGDDESQTVMDRKRGVPETVIDKEDYDILTRAIQSLPKKCRRIFTLRKVYGLSLNQISHELGISVKTVEAQISIGIRKSRDYFMKLQEDFSQ